MEVSDVRKDYSFSLELVIAGRATLPRFLLSGVSFTNPRLPRFFIDRTSIPNLVFS
jgi:hypothetical protein